MYTTINKMSLVTQWALLFILLNIIYHFIDITIPHYKKKKKTLIYCLRVVIFVKNLVF